MYRFLILNCLIAAFSLVISGCDCGNRSDPGQPSSDITAIQPPTSDDAQDAQPRSVTEGPLTLSIDRSAYYRYMIVHIKVESSDPSLQPTAHIERDGKVMMGVGEAPTVDLIPDEGVGRWRGSWAMPWNPPLGECELVVETTQNGGKTLRLKVPFTIKKRELPPAPPGMAVVTLESDSEFDGKGIEGYDGKVTDWRGLAGWAHYMGASHFFYSVGITKARWAPTADKPWKQYNLDFALKLGQECHNQGIKFGGWAGAFLAYGTTPVSTCGYTPSRNLTDSGVWVSTLHFSLADTKRRKDLTELCRWMQQHDEFDWIGLDYIRSGFGGYELVDLFVNEMGIPTPPEWSKMSLDKKMSWFTGQLRGKRDKVMIERWQWWRASYVARFVAEIHKEAGITKPFFVFTLGWEMGHQHGQDPLMFNDAGAYDLVMLYEATRDEFDYMMKSWPQYLGKDQGAILAGNCVDYNLLENRWAPGRQPPDEFYLRTEQAVTGMKADSGILQGVFWHDLERALWLRRGPNWMPSDYALSGASSFSEFRNVSGALPIRIEVENAGTAGGRYQLKVTVTNISRDAVQGLEVSVVRTNGTARSDDSRMSIGTLAAGESKTLQLPFHAQPIKGEKLIPRWKRKLEAAEAERKLTPEEKKALQEQERAKLGGGKKAKGDKTAPPVIKVSEEKTGLAIWLPVMVGAMATWEAQYPLDRAFAYTYLYFGK